MSQVLENVAKLAREMEQGLPLAPGAVFISEDGDVRVERKPAAFRHHFFLDGLMFHVSVTPQNGTTLVQFWAEVGYMPFSIESPEKRTRLAAILRATQGMEHARFVLDEQQKILVLGQKDVPGTLTLQDLLYALTFFLQEARPFLKVFGQYL